MLENSLDTAETVPLIDPVVSTRNATSTWLTVSEKVWLWVTEGPCASSTM